MSFVFKNSVEMSKSQINRSPTKQAFSFTKQSRFDPKEQTAYCEKLYDLPVTITQRSAGIGYGGRSKENQYRETIPGPSHYQQQQQTVSQEAKKNNGWTMGVSREKMEQFSIIPKGKNLSPGPGQFFPQTTLSNVAFTMRGRPKETKESLSKNEPGPGSYERLPSLTSKGKQFVSNFKSVKTTIFSPANLSRFPKEYKDMNPGPGQYDFNHQMGLSPIGHYFISNLKGSGCRTFNKAIINRNQANENYTIGPGSYELPSEFGVYNQPNQEQQFLMTQGQIYSSENQVRSTFNQKQK